MRTRVAPLQARSVWAASLRSAVALFAVPIGLLLAGATSRPAPAFSGTSAGAPAGGSATEAVLAATSATTLSNDVNTTTATTIVPIQNQLPARPVTLRLTTRQASTRINPVLAKVAIGGFAMFLLLVVIQLFLTRRDRRGRWTL